MYIIILLQAADEALVLDVLVLLVLLLSQVPEGIDDDTCADVDHDYQNDDQV